MGAELTVDEALDQLLDEQEGRSAPRVYSDDENVISPLEVGNV